MWWRWRLRHEPEHGVASPQLLPVVVESRGVAPSHRVEIAVADVRLRVEAGTDVAYVAALVGALPEPDADAGTEREGVPRDRAAGRLRRGHDGLCALVRGQHGLDPFAGHLLFFVGRRIDRN